MLDNIAFMHGPKMVPPHAVANTEVMQSVQRHVKTVSIVALTHDRSTEKPHGFSTPILHQSLPD